MLKGKEYWDIKPYKPIIPERILFKKHGYVITKLHPSYHIPRYFVVVDNKKNNIIKEIILFKCFHPNAFGEENPNINKPPKYSKMCLPKQMIDNFKFSPLKNYLKLPGDKTMTTKDIEFGILWIWQMDDPHHWLDHKYVTAERKIYRGLVSRRLQLPEVLFNYK